MAELTRFPDPVWERFFDFAFGCERDEKLTRGEVQDDLRRFGVDVRAAVSKAQGAVAVARARAELREAKEKRPGLLTRLTGAVAPAGAALRSHLRGLIENQFQGKVQAAYYRKLESAATDEDLQSLLEDMHLLESLSEDTPDADSGAK